MANDIAETISGGVIVSIMEREPLDWDEFRTRGRRLGIDTAARASIGPRDLVYNAQFSSEEEFDRHAKGTSPEMWRMYPSASTVDIAFYPSDKTLPAWSRTYRHPE